MSKLKAATITLLLTTVVLLLVATIALVPPKLIIDTLAIVVAFVIFGIIVELVYTILKGES